MLNNTVPVTPILVQEHSFLKMLDRVKSAELISGEKQPSRTPWLPCKILIRLVEK